MERAAPAEALVSLAGGEVEGGAGAGIVGEFGHEALKSGLSVGIAAGLELGLAEGKLRGGRFRVERDGLAECGDGGVVLLQAHIGRAQAEIRARIIGMVANEFLKERDGPAELSRGKVGAGELLLIRGVRRGGGVGFLESGNSLGVISSG